MSVSWGSQQRRGDLELLELLNKEREWERTAKQLTRFDAEGLKRGIRNGFLFVTPFYLLLGRIFGWW